MWHAQAAMTELWAISRPQLEKLSPANNSMAIDAINWVRMPLVSEQKRTHAHTISDNCQHDNMCVCVGTPRYKQNRQMFYH